MENNWIKFSEQKPTEQQDYLCHWHQDKYNNGFAIFYWQRDRWANTDSLHSHAGTRFVTHYQELEEPKDE